MQPLVSVIVPAYNAEKHILKCVSSILDQTYENIELIVVDDGSIDNTYNLLKPVATQDKRMQVVHIDNKGVSNARNVGIRASNGQYIVFVDADDYILDEFIEYMVKLALETKAEFCLSKKCFTKKNENQSYPIITEILSPDECTALLLSPQVIVGCWNKIFSKSFIEKNNLFFSTELYYGEGLSFIINAAQKSSKIGVGNKKVYYYRRNNELSATTAFDIKKLINGELALNKIKKNISINTQKVNDMFYLHMSLYSLGAVVRIINNGCKEKHLSEYKHWKKNIWNYSKKILLKKNVTLYRKIMLVGGFAFPSLIAKLDLLRRNKMKKNSI